MKNKIVTLLLLLPPLAGIAQTTVPLPYYSGFDNQNQKNGWSFVRNGSTQAMGWNYSESFNAGYTPPSSPNCLQHPPATAGDPNALTIDWFTSPGLLLGNGGKVALKINVFTMGGLMSGDSILLYLLHGGTKTLLADFASMSTSNLNFRDTLLDIPPTPGTSFLSFKYTTYNNWFSVGIDNINVAGISTNINSVQEPNYCISIYPNPADDEIKWNVDQQSCNQAVYLQDAYGQIVCSGYCEQGSMNISSLPGGVYYFVCGQNVQHLIKK